MEGAWQRVSTTSYPTRTFVLYIILVNILIWCFPNFDSDPRQCPNKKKKTNIFYFK